MCRRRGFSLLELLIVIGIILLLMTLAMPVVNNAWEMARRVHCQSNMRQLTTAFLHYAHDNHDVFLPLSTPSAQAGYPTSDNQSQVIPALYRYATDSRVFHCPSDVRPSTTTSPLSYSINDYLNGTWPAFNNHAVRMTEIHDPSSIFVLIEEYDTNPKAVANSGGFVVQPSPSAVWVDWPGQFHGHGSCLSFLDGRVEYWDWSDERTWALAKHLTSTPNNPDLIKLQAVQGPVN